MQYLLQVDTSGISSILCVLLQGDSCEEVGIQLVQTLTVVFPPSIRAGLIGKPP